MEIIKNTLSSMGYNLSKIIDYAPRNQNEMIKLSLELFRDELASIIKLIPQKEISVHSILKSVEANLNKIDFENINPNREFREIIKSILESTNTVARFYQEQ